MQFKPLFYNSIFRAIPLRVGLYAHTLPTPKSVVQGNRFNPYCVGSTKENALTYTSISCNPLLGRSYQELFNFLISRNATLVMFTNSGWAGQCHNRIEADLSGMSSHDIRSLRGELLKLSLKKVFESSYFRILDGDTGTLYFRNKANDSKTYISYKIPQKYVSKNFNSIAKLLQPYVKPEADQWSTSLSGPNIGW